MTAATHRPLPDDPAIAALDERLRADVALNWRSRARNELSTSTVFASLVQGLVRVSAPSNVLREAAAAVADEVRHAEICMHVARAYWPECPEPEPRTVVEVPDVADAETRDLTALLFVVMQSCVNEGVACAYLQACLAQSAHALARAAVRDILADEIRHARFGWTLLSADFAGPRLCRAVSEALPTLLERVADVWCSRAAAGLPDPAPGHGTIAARDIPGVVRSAYEELIVPGFEQVGIDARGARGWLAQSQCR